MDRVSPRNAEEAGLKVAVSKVIKKVRKAEQRGAVYGMDQVRQRKRRGDTSEKTSSVV